MVLGKKAAFQVLGRLHPAYKYLRDLKFTGINIFKTITAKQLVEMTYNMYKNCTKCHKFQVRIGDGSDDYVSI